MNYPNQPPFPTKVAPNINLAIVSVVLGVLGIFCIIPTILFTFCAILPIAFGIGAIIVGFLARSRAGKDPVHWGGAGLAIGGIIAGAASILAPVAIIIFMVIIYAGMIGAGQLGR